MKLKYLGHAAFELVLADNRRILFDPYEPGSYDGAVRFDPVETGQDIVVVSHDHPDHRWEKAVEDAGIVIESAGEYDLNGVKITSYLTYHDETEGSERGTNLVSIVEADGLRVAHMGDLGHMIDVGSMPALKGVDLIMLPVGGFFTIDSRMAAEITRLIGPGIVVPMHFKTEKLGFPIASVDGFTEIMDNVEIMGGSELEIVPSALPESIRVVVLEPAM
ncbi:MAG: MBL fold metallo-hydrolase [Bacteroidales bacterium]|nr:MBL fold metallo-hydrolase [Candidatus Latescibacterota bacterium]